MKLYHGSPRRLKGDKLFPTLADDLEKNPENMKKGVYATDIKEQAIAMAIISAKGVLGASLGDYGDKRYGRIYMGKPDQKYVYLHILDSNLFEKCKSVKNQYFSKESIVPIKTERISGKDNLNLLKKPTKKQIEEWKKKHWDQ